jgi:hypothetical protein
MPRRRREPLALAGRAATLRRGRPPKYGRPGKVVALTLPREIVQTLHQMNSDLGWAIVSLVEKHRRRRTAERPATHDAELVDVGDSNSLIVVNAARFHALPGVQMVPLSATQAFLALEPGRGMADLELAVLDRVEHLPPDDDERRALEALRDQLQRWRRDRKLGFHNRSIILVERLTAANTAETA